MFHTTHCEILGDLLPQNVTIQHTLHAEPVLSFILRTFEDRPDLDLPSGNSSNQSSSQGSIPATSSARTARSSSTSSNPRYQAQATSNSCYHDSCGFSSAPRFALWDQQSCSRALAQEQAQLQVLQASTPNYASGVENIAVARATEDDTDIATAQIAEEHELSRPRKYKISFRALDENEDSDIDDDNADSESSESSEIDADLAANCVSGGDSQLNAAALEANKKLQGSSSYLIQYRRCVMLHLTVEQIQSYSQLLKTHRKYMLYVSGRLVPYYSVLDSGAHNVALSSGIKVPDRMQRQQGLSYTANNTFDYQRQNAEQELILVVDALYLIDPQLQHQPELLQETLMRHQVSAAISVPLLSQAQAQAHNNVVSANNAQASTASDYSAQVQAATAATAIPAAKAEACAQATATATATADNAAYADNTTAIEDTTTREDAEVVTDLTSAQTVTAPAPQEQPQQLTLQAAYPLAQTTVSSILAVNLPEIPEELLRSHENCPQSGNMPLPHCSYTHYVRPAQSKSTNQRVRAHQEQVKATAPSISATHTAKPMVESTVPPANAAPSSQQQAQQLRNDELVASCVAPSLSIKVPQPNSTVLNKSTVINTAVDYARQISSRFTSPQASATPVKAPEQPPQSQPRPTPLAQAQAQVNLQPQVPPQVQVQAQVQAQPLPAQGQPLPPQTQQGSFSTPQGMRSVTNNHAQMNNQSAQEVTPLPFPLGSSEPNNDPHAEPVDARQGVRTYRHTDCSAPTASYCTCAATGAGTATAANAGASATTRAASGASTATGPSICATASTGISAATGAGASTGSAACTGICAATTARAGASAATDYGNYTQGHYAARQAHAQTAPATLADSQDRSTGNLANTGTNQYSHSGCNSSSGGNGYANSCGSTYIRDAFHANASKPRSKPVPISNGSTQLSNVERILSQDQYAQQSYAAECATLSHAQSATFDLRGQKTQILSSTLYTDRALGGNTASLARPCDLVSHNRDASRDPTNVAPLKTLDAIAPLEQEPPLKKEIPLAPTTQHAKSTGAAVTSSNNSANTAQKYLQSLRKHPAAALAIKAPLEGRSFTEFLHTWQTQGRLAAIGLKPIKLQLMVLGKDAKFKVNPRNIDSLAEAILASAVEANQGKKQPDLATQYRPLPKPFAPKQPLPQLLSNKAPKDKK